MSEQLDGFTEAWLINSVAEIFTPEHIADYSLEATRMFIRRLEDHLADLREHECGSPEIVEGSLCRFRRDVGFPDLVVDRR